MNQPIKIFKFGGASIENSERIKKVAHILESYQTEPIVIVISAMGKTTNALEKVVDAYMAQDGTAFELFEAIKNSHFSTMLELFDPKDEVFASVNDTFVEIEWVIEDEPNDPHDYIYDQIVSIGEMVSSKIIAAYLKNQGLTNHWLDVRDVILTDDTFREGIVQWTDTQQRCNLIIPKLLTENKLVVTQGFIGGTSENFTTTLGREGSDFSAAILAYCLNAESISIWKDVPGILTGDPRLFKNVSKIDRLSYKEAIEMTYYGAKVIHPKTIKPLQNKRIPLYVKSFLKPEGEGTYISDDVDTTYPPVVVVETNQSLLHFATKDFSFVAVNHLSHLFHLFAKHRIKINMMRNQAISFSACVTNISERLIKLIEELESDFHILKEDDLELITVRHFQESMMDALVKGKVILFEERIGKTVQMVVKEIPVMERK